jgi:hypothetical protein
MRELNFVKQLYKHFIGRMGGEAGEGRGGPLPRLGEKRQRQHSPHLRAPSFGQM